MYLSMTFGWIIGELVSANGSAPPIVGALHTRRDRAAAGNPRPLGRNSRMRWRGALRSRSMPWCRFRQSTCRRCFWHRCRRRLRSRRSCSNSRQCGARKWPGSAEYSTARSEARFWAMLANGGELNGVRILSKTLVDTLNTPRANSDEPDPVMFGIPLPISIGGFWLGGSYPPVCSAQSPRALCHPGQGGSIGWADPDEQRRGRNLSQPSIQREHPRSGCDSGRCERRACSARGQAVTAAISAAL